MPDDLDRLFERLVTVLAQDAPGRLAIPFPAAEVYERLVPYRSNRSTLKVATHEDYEMAVMRLLSGERGYASLDLPDVQEALGREANESNPDTGLFRQFPQAILSLNRIAAERFLGGDRSYAPPRPPRPRPRRCRRRRWWHRTRTPRTTPRNRRSRSPRHRSSWPSSRRRRVSVRTAVKPCRGRAR